MAEFGDCYEKYELCLNKKQVYDMALTNGNLKNVL